MVRNAPRKHARGAVALRERARTEPASGNEARHVTPGGARASVRLFRLPSLKLSWSEWAHRSLPIMALLLVSGLTLAGWRLLDHVGSVPVSRVLFTGKLEHVDRAAMVERVQPLLIGEGFLTANIDGIRDTVMALPWVADASVRRRWPDELVVDVREHQPIARWGDDGLLSRSGQVFRPQPLAVGAGLPALFGPDQLAGEVVARYAELTELLAERGLKVLSIGTDQRGSWRLQLEGGVVLRLGTHDVLKKMRRFLSAYEYELRAQLTQIAYVDLRYTNGLAVGWKTAQQSRG